VVVRVTGSEAWLGFSAFPPAEAAAVEWFLSSAGGAAGGMDGRLVRGRPPALGMDAYDYDPADPVPTLGGAVWPFAPARLVPGDLDQSPVEQRPDVLVYTSEPLAEDLVVVGPVTLELWAASSACDTDFTGKLVDVDPYGAARWVQDGILRCRFRNGPWQEELLEPQRAYRLEIPLGTVAHRFAAGHRLRLEVASSNFPKFDNNLNTAVSPHLATAGTVARQTVFHGGAMASCLRLLAMPADALEALRVAL
jgi:putative CocE/NonD family hydrolase